ncbi:MAG: YjjG family noncanonical pyrimidine nucleotidase [Traorella sp.]
MIRLICFDIDDTLMDFHKGERIAFFESMKEHHISCNEEEYHEYELINEALWKALERNEVTKERLKVQRFEEFALKCHKDFDAIKMCQSFVYHLGNQCFLFEGADEVVKKCFTLCDLAITTNGISSIQRNRLQLSGLSSYFKYLFISEEMGCVKPQKEYYDEILKQTHLSANEIMIVGDSLSADMLGAVNHGFVSVWYNPKHELNLDQLAIDYVIDDLREVIHIWEEKA